MDDLVNAFYDNNRYECKKAKFLKKFISTAKKMVSRYESKEKIPIEVAKYLKILEKNSQDNSGCYLHSYRRLCKFRTIFGRPTLSS